MNGFKEGVTEPIERWAGEGRRNAKKFHFLRKLVRSLL